MPPIDPAHMLFLGFWDLIEVSCEDYWVGFSGQIHRAGRGFTCTGFAHDRRPEIWMGLWRSAPTSTIARANLISAQPTFRTLAKIVLRAAYTPACKRRGRIGSIVQWCCVHRCTSSSVIHGRKHRLPDSNQWLACDVPRATFLCSAAWQERHSQIT